MFKYDTKPVLRKAYNLEGNLLFKSVLKPSNEYSKPSSEFSLSSTTFFEDVKAEKQSKQIIIGEKQIVNKHKDNHDDYEDDDDDALRQKEFDEIKSCKNINDVEKIKLKLVSQMDVLVKKVQDDENVNAEIKYLKEKIQLLHDVSCKITNKTKL